MHVDTDLSAYLDGELDPSDRARVEAHLDTCDRCRARLSELRATASLIASLPTVRPSRSLVPRVMERFNWLRPIRSLSAVASGAFLFALLVTAVARGGSGLGGGAATTAAGPAGQAAAPLAATAAPERAFGPAQPVPAPLATAALDTAQGAPGAPPGASAGAAFAIGPSPQPQKAAEAATARPRVEVSASPAGVTPSPDAAIRLTYGQEPRSPLTDPFLWLGLAVIAAAVAIGAHRRLRTT